MKTFVESPVKTSVLIQNYENQKVPELAIIGDDMKQIGPWMKCKDYIQDVICANNTQTNFYIYGFQYSYMSGPHAKTGINLAIRWDGKTKDEMSTYFHNVRATLLAFEKKAKVSAKSKVFLLKNNQILVLGSNDWRRCIATISFFATICRLGLLNTGKTIKTFLQIKYDKSFAQDAYYIGIAQTFVNKLLNDGIESFVEEDWQFASQDYIPRCHGNGFVRWASNHGGRSAK